MGVVVVRSVRFWEDVEVRVKPVVVSKDQGCEDGPNVAFKGVVSTMARVGLLICTRISCCGRVMGIGIAVGSLSNVYEYDTT